jgi:single-strand DNA-binding protein
MAGDLNRTILMGRLVADPELKQTSTGFSVSENRIAVKRRYVRDGGQDVDFFSFVAKRHVADYLVRYFHKGDRLVIIGELHNDEYVDREGNKRSFTKVDDVDVYSIKEYKGDDTGNNVDSNTQTYDAPQYAKSNSPSFEQLRQDDDLPF